MASMCPIVLSQVVCVAYELQHNFEILADFGDLISFSLAPLCLEVLAIHRRFYQNPIDTKTKGKEKLKLNSNQFSYLGIIKNNFNTRNVSVNII